MAKKGDVTFKLEGLDQLLRRLDNYTTEISKRRLLLRSIKRVILKSRVVNIAQDFTPESDFPHKDKQGVEYQPGNLKKSIALFVGRSKTNPNIQVGYAKGRKWLHDGWYGLIVSEGYGRGQKPTRPFDKAFNLTKNRLNSSLLADLKKVVKRQAKRHGFR